MQNKKNDENHLPTMCAADVNGGGLINFSHTVLMVGHMIRSKLIRILPPTDVEKGLIVYTLPSCTVWEKLIAYESNHYEAIAMRFKVLGRLAAVSPCYTQKSDLLTMELPNMHSLQYRIYAIPNEDRSDTIQIEFEPSERPKFIY